MDQNTKQKLIDDTEDKMSTLWLIALLFYTSSLIYSILYTLYMFPEMLERFKTVCEIGLG